MRVWVISDTHNGHHNLKVPTGIDMVIHAGDCSTHPIPEINSHEVLRFIEWYESLYIPHKIFVPGNHDTSIERGLVTFPDNITVLKHDTIVIDGIKIFGSPYTPTYGKWSFMVPRNKLNVYWSVIPDDTDILITHGPPKGILDANSYGEHVGCAALKKAVDRVMPKYHLFGHIHEEAGTIMEYFTHPTKFINAAVCGMMYVYVNDGYVFEL